jgi:hypothetical protein
MVSHQKPTRKRSGRAGRVFLIIRRARRPGSGFPANGPLKSSGRKRKTSAKKNPEKSSGRKKKKPAGKKSGP